MSPVAHQIHTMLLVLAKELFPHSQANDLTIGVALQGLLQVLKNMTSFVLCQMEKSTYPMKLPLPTMDVATMCFSNTTWDSGLPLTVHVETLDALILTQLIPLNNFTQHLSIVLKYFYIFGYIESSKSYTQSVIHEVYDTQNN